MGNSSRDRGELPSFDEAIASGSGSGGGDGGRSNSNKQLQSKQQPQPQAPEASPFRTRFACVTLAMTDRIRFINFPSSVIDRMPQAISSAWPRGIQDYRLYAGAPEFKVRGNPWRSSTRGNDDARRLVSRILEALYDRGWVLHMAVDIIRKDTGKDTLFFRHQNPPPPPCDWLTLSFDRSDRLKIVDPPPSDVTGALLRTLGRDVSRCDVTRQHLEIRFHGMPWFPSGEGTVKTPRMMLAILETLETFGYSLYMSLDAQRSNEGNDADIIVMHRQKNWVEGMPIFHR